MISSGVRAGVPDIALQTYDQGILQGFTVVRDGVSFGFQCSHIQLNGFLRHAHGMVDALAIRNAPRQRWDVHRVTTFWFLGEEDAVGVLRHGRSNGMLSYTVKRDGSEIAPSCLRLNQIPAEMPKKMMKR